MDVQTARDSVRALQAIVSECYETSMETVSLCLGNDPSIMERGGEFEALDARYEALVSVLATPDMQALRATEEDFEAVMEMLDISATLDEDADSDESAESYREHMDEMESSRERVLEEDEKTLQRVHDIAEAHMAEARVVRAALDEQLRTLRFRFDEDAGSGEG